MVNPPSFLLFVSSFIFISLLLSLASGGSTLTAAYMHQRVRGPVASPFGAHIHTPSSRSLWPSRDRLCQSTLTSYPSLFPGPPLTPALCQQGQFQEQLPPRTVLGGTKWCVFKHGDISRATVETAVRERMTRMRTRQLDFLQVRTNFSHYTFLFRPCHLSCPTDTHGFRRPIPV